MSRSYGSTPPCSSKMQISHISPILTPSASNSEHGQSDDADSVASDCSTLQYDHTPFVEFQKQVHDLCLELFDNVDETSVEIERMKGGAGNRVIGLKFKQLPTSSQPTPVINDYILRIPRDEDDNLDRHEINMKYAATVSSIPVPETVKLDTTNDNLIHCPYLLQKRIPGQTLLQTWPLLNLQQRLSVSRQIGVWFKTLRAFPTSRGGMLDTIWNSQPWPNQPPMLRFPQLSVTGEPYVEPGIAAPLESPLEMLRSRFDTWVAKDMKWKSKTYETLSRAVDGMNDSTKVFESEFYLYHGDFQPRNVLVEIVDDGEVCLTGILDWDSSHFAPAIVAFEPPCWLWMPDYWNDDSNISNSSEAVFMSEALLCQKANLIPENEDDKKIKEAFEKTLESPFVLRFAYDKNAVDARRIYRIALDGLYHSWVHVAAMRICEPWEAAAWEIKRNGLAPPDPDPTLPEIHMTMRIET